MDGSIYFVFLDWKLKQGYHGKTFFETKPEDHGIPQGLLEVSFIPGLEVPPTLKELLALNQTEGFPENVRAGQKVPATGLIRVRL
jgi:hypothetical protein